MTGVHTANGAASLGIDVIDRIGVVRIAETLGISPQAVRKWRRKGKIPDDRQDDLQQMLAELPDQVSALSQVAEVSKAVKVVPPAPRRATGSNSKKGDIEEPAHQALAVVPADPPRLEQVAGQHAQASMTLLIAARDVDQARVVVDKAVADAEGLPPVLPVWGYRTRLALLFALDFPILTMAFVTVTQVSPIIAAGSAIALSLGLVLCAHAAGARLPFGDDQLLEVMMNLTGTIIVATPIDDGDGTTAPLVFIPANYLLFEAMLEGGDVIIQSCGADTSANGCLEPQSQIVTLEGFEERMRRLLLGDDVSPGIVAKLRANDQELTEEENELLANIPGGASGLLVRLVGISGDAATTFVELLIPHLSTEWARIITRDLIETVALAITLIDSEHAPGIDELVQQARLRLNAEVEQKQRDHGPLADLIRSYTDLLDASESTIFALQNDVIERP